MTVFVCVDEALGRTFLSRRQSRDEAVCQDVLKAAQSGTLWMHPKSLPLFGGAGIGAQNALSMAQKGDFCFCEFDALLPHAERIDTLILYRWNRRYPADVYLDLIPEEHGFSRHESVELVGKSHPVIKKEVFVK